MYNHIRVLYDPAAESNGNGGTSFPDVAVQTGSEKLTALLDQSSGKPVESAEKAAQIPQDKLVTLPVSGDGSITIPIQENGRNHLLAPADQNLAVTEFDGEFEVPVVHQSTTDQQQQAVQKFEPKTEVIKQGAEQQQQSQDQQAQKLPDQAVHPDHARQSRDYSVFEEQADREIARAMPNVVYNYLKVRIPALLKRTVEAESKFNGLLQSQGIPANYFEHPEAYRTTPVYQQKELMYDRLEFEENHAAIQLQQIGAGVKVIKKLVSFDTNGNAITTDIVVTDENKAELVGKFQRLLGTIGAKKDTVASEAVAIKQMFDSRRGNLLKLVNEGEDRFFPFYKKGHPQCTDQDLQNIEIIRKALPYELQDSTLAPALAKAFYMIQELKGHIKQLQAVKGSVAQSNVVGQQQKTAPANGSIQQRAAADAAVVDGASGTGGSDGTLRVSDWEEPQV